MNDFDNGPLAPNPGGEGPEPPLRRRTPFVLALAVVVTLAAAGAGLWFARSLRPADEAPADDTTGTAAHAPHGALVSGDSGVVATDSVITAADLPGFDVELLTNAQRLWLYHHAHLEECGCGCGMNVAQCRVEDPTCPKSPGRARELVEEAKRARPSG